MRNESEVYQSGGRRHCDGSWVPETPAKRKPERPQHIFPFKRLQLDKPLESQPALQVYVSQHDSSAGTKPLELKVYVRKSDPGSGAKDEGLTPPGTCKNQICRRACNGNAYGHSDLKVFNWEENLTQDTKACSGFEGLYDHNVELLNLPSVALALKVSANESIRCETDSSLLIGSSSETQEAVERSISFQHSVSQAGISIQEIDKESLLVANKDLLLASDLNDSSCPNSCISNHDQETDVQHNVVSQVFSSLPTPAPKEKTVKVTKAGMDVKRRLQKRPKVKIKKHRPKIAEERKTKVALPSKPKPATPTSASSGEKKHVKATKSKRRTIVNRRKENLVPEHGIPSYCNTRAVQESNKVGIKLTVSSDCNTRAVQESNEVGIKLTVPSDCNTRAIQESNEAGTKLTVPSDCNTRAIQKSDEVGTRLTVQPNDEKSIQSWITNWGTFRKRSFREYSKKLYMMDVSQYDLRSVFRRKGRIDACLNRIRELSLDVPKGCKKKRIHRPCRRWLHIFREIVNAYPKKRRSKFNTAFLDSQVSRLKQENDSSCSAPIETLMSGMNDTEDLVTTVVKPDGQEKEDVPTSKVHGETSKAHGEIGDYKGDRGSLILIKKLKPVAKSRGRKKGGNTVAKKDEDEDPIIASFISKMDLIPKMEALHISKEDSAIVIHQGRTKIRMSRIVNLDLDQLMRIGDGGGEGKEEDRDKEKWWEEEREAFRGRIDVFLSRMRLILGDRKFKPWKGSVIDSVVGVFLTQNVSDHLSCKTFMSIVAKFPPQSRSVNQYFITEPEADMHLNASNYPVEMPEIASLVDIEDLQCGQTSDSNAASISHFPAPSEFPFSLELSRTDDSVGQKWPPEFEQIMLDEAHASSGNSTKKKAVKKKKKVEKKKWDEWRKTYSRERSLDQMDSVDWEAVRLAPVDEIAKIIQGRGQHNQLAKRIQDLLNNVLTLHGSLDLEWLRYAPPDIVKEYLLAVDGLGLKSVECIRLLELQHVAFPVDTNVARIAVRLGWIPLKPLPGNLLFHHLDVYPLMDGIQKYLWPRICMLNQRILYELHYNLITFGKVICRKQNPNCNACPMKAECKHFASVIASQKFCLPASSKKATARSIVPTAPVMNPPFPTVVVSQISEGPHPTPGNGSKTQNSEFYIEGNGSRSQNSEVYIEEPPSPEHVEDVGDTEDACNYQDNTDDEEIPIIKLNKEGFIANKQSFWDNYNSSGNSCRALVPLSMEAASVPVRKLKVPTRLRTEHQVYELPDNHELLAGLERREHDDTVPYLLAIWIPAETAETSQPPETRCNFQGTQLCDDSTCFSCECIREERAGMVRGTILIPYRTALKGSFPLNGTYFQVNEVFADHASSYKPINVPRRLLWNLPMRTVYFGISSLYIFRGLSLEDIAKNFHGGFICLRGFERGTGAPRPLSSRFHCPPTPKKGKAEEPELSPQVANAKIASELPDLNDDPLDF